MKIAVLAIKWVPIMLSMVVYIDIYQCIYIWTRVPLTYIAWRMVAAAINVTPMPFRFGSSSCMSSCKRAAATSLYFCSWSAMLNKQLPVNKNTFFRVRKTRQNGTVKLLFRCVRKNCDRELWNYCPGRSLRTHPLSTWVQYEC